MLAVSEVTDVLIFRELPVHSEAAQEGTVHTIVNAVAYGALAECMPNRHLFLPKMFCHGPVSSSPRWPP